MWTRQSLLNHKAEELSSDGKWTPARPINWKYRTVRQRLKEAWAVFTGKADAFIWDATPPQHTAAATGDTEGGE